MPNIETIELPFKIHTPKPRLKFQVPSIQLKSKEKKSKKSASPEKSENEIEAERQLYRNEYILPLQVNNKKCFSLLFRKKKKKL